MTTSTGEGSPRGGSRADGPMLRGFWWCPSCLIEISDDNVTYEEHHDACGAYVEWVEPHDSALLRGGQGRSPERVERDLYVLVLLLGFTAGFALAWAVL